MTEEAVSERRVKKGAKSAGGWMGSVSVGPSSVMLGSGSGEFCLSAGVSGRAEGRREGAG